MFQKSRDGSSHILSCLRTSPKFIPHSVARDIFSECKSGYFTHTHTLLDPLSKPCHCSKIQPKLLTAAYKGLPWSDLPVPPALSWASLQPPCPSLILTVLPRPLDLCTCYPTYLEGFFFSPVGLHVCVSKVTFFTLYFPIFKKKINEML